ncbi:MAG: lycopene cyclase domain-containing protein [Chloroflexi bacterium]|nr:MAG: lycopene cyclase domain-containing protein [Chloroflexota bacterium]
MDMDQQSDLGSALVGYSAGGISFLPVGGADGNYVDLRPVHKKGEQGEEESSGGEVMTHWLYLPFLLVWALPVIAVQWLAGWRYLWRERGFWPWIVLGLALYFSLADAVAIQAGIWRFDTTSLVGWWLGPVPVEEILFYLLTATMVVQTVVIVWHSKRL